MDNFAMTTVHWVMLALSTLTAIFVWWARTHKPEWFHILFNFPIHLFGHIGEINKLKKNTEQVTKKSSWIDGMPQPEATLCKKYASVMTQAKSEASFNNAKEYLRLSYQNDIEPMPLWMITILFVLTMVESLGTGFLLAPHLSKGVTANQALVGGLAIALAFAIILLALTHAAGESVKKITMIKTVLGSMDKNAKPHDMQSDEQISVEMDQNIDNGTSGEARFYRRVIKGRDRGSWTLSIVVVVMLSIVMALVFSDRWGGVLAQETDKVTQVEQSGASGDNSNPFASAGADASQDNLPPDVVKSQDESRKKVAKEIRSADLLQGFSASVLLAVIYVLTQLVGFWFSYKHSFIGSGKKAYAMTLGEHDYASYYSKYVYPFESKAESALIELRRHFASGNTVYASAPSVVTFHEFITHKASDPSGALHQPIPVAQPAEKPTADVQETPSQTTSVDYDDVAERIMALPEAQRAGYFAEWLKSNGTQHKEAVKAALVRAKERKSMAAVDAELLDLMKD